MKLTLEAKRLQNIFKALAAHAQEAKLEVRDGWLWLRTMGFGSVTYTHYNHKIENGDSLDGLIGLTDYVRVLKGAKGDATFEAQKTHATLTYKNCAVRLPYFVEKEKQQFPNVNALKPALTMRCDAKELRNAIETVAALEPDQANVSLAYDGKSVCVKFTSDTGKSAEMAIETSFISDGCAPFAAKYGAEYLLASLSFSDTEVSVAFGKDYPLLVKCEELGQWSFVSVVAPRIDNPF